MAKFLNTRKAISEIEDLIRNAESTLTLISPYLKLSKDFKELLTYRNSKDKITTVIFGKQELKPDEMEFLEGLRFVILRYHEDLHAKCYLNDSSMIITSLNLYEFSMANNKEMGILLDKNDPNDNEVYEDAYKEVDFLFETSVRFEFKSGKTFDNAESSKKSKPKNSIQSQRKSDSTRMGFCIRTKKEIPFDIEKPFCSEAFKAWNKYKNKDFKEKYCHFSGEPSNGETSFSKPILAKNWKKAKEVHG